MNRITIIFFFLFLCIFQGEVCVGQERQRTTIRFKNQSLDSALCQLQKQIGCFFFYQDSIVGKPNKINQNFKDKTTSHILDELLENTNCSYIINDGKWVIFYKKVGDSPKTVQVQESMSFSISGKVLDENGKFAHGVSVGIINEFDKYLSNDVFFTITDNDGNYLITTMDSNAYVILMYVGHLPRVVHIKYAKLIKLEPDVDLLKKVWRIGNI